MDDAKLKRWGWGAIIGLIGVILVAGLVVAISMSSPKPNETEVVSGKVEIADGEKDGDAKKEDAGAKKAEEEQAKKEAEAKKKEEEQKEAEQKIAAQKEAEQKRLAEEEKQRAAANQNGSSNGTSKMPKTGPADTTFAIVGASVVVYLIALNYNLMKKRA